jgi:orotate phosphoribosyltransferase
VDRRAELCQAIREKGFLYSADGNLISDRRGFERPWILYLWPLTMSADGCELLASELLPGLEQFEATTLAAYGASAVPLMMACVAHGAGRYDGVMVRANRKTHGALRQVDGGVGNRRVVIIDDSISSGTSFRAAASALETNGYEVEGTLVVVDFPFRGGREWAEARGYRVNALFDVWRDLGMPQPRHSDQGYLNLMPDRWSSTRAPDGLHPAHVARLAASHYLGTGEVLLPPRFLNTGELGAGGVWVSFRTRVGDIRVARNGFWHFDPFDSDPPRDVILAAVKTVSSAPAPLTVAALDKLKMAVTFFGPLEPAQPADLDFRRYGVVARSRVTDRLGGALPNTQHFTSTIEQYRHARETNARIGPFEPHDLYRHEVYKLVEPGATWPKYGSPDTEAWADEQVLGQALAERAVGILDSLAAGDDKPPSTFDSNLVPGSVGRVGVTIYRGGAAGCAVASAGSIDDALSLAAAEAAKDHRLGLQPGLHPARDAIVISLLHDPEDLGSRGTKYAAWKLRAGKDSLSVTQGERRATFLETVLPHRNWTKEQMTHALIEKAGIANGPMEWTTYKTESWVLQNDVVHRLDGGAALRGPEQQGLEEHNLHEMACHLVRRLDLNGWPAYFVEPRTGTFSRQGVTGRCIHGLRALCAAGLHANRPDWHHAGVTGLLWALESVGTGATTELQLRGHVTGHMGEAQLLEAACAINSAEFSGRQVDKLAARVRLWLRDSGEVRPTGVSPSAADADFLPGLALLALCRYSMVRGECQTIPWDQIRAWYERRFRAVGGWGLASWHCKLWPLVADITGDETHTEFAFVLADWMVEQQLRHDGSYLTDLDGAGPGYHTAAIAEGIACAWRCAVKAMDSTRAETYERSWLAAMSCMNRLLVQPADTYWMQEPVVAVGAVRRDLTSFDLRVDYTSHCVLALIEGLEMQAMCGSNRPTASAASIPGSGCT